MHVDEKVGCWMLVERHIREVVDAKVDRRLIDMLTLSGRCGGTRLA